MVEVEIKSYRYTKHGLVSFKGIIKLPSKLSNEEVDMFIRDVTKDIAKNTQKVMEKNG